MAKTYAQVVGAILVIIGIIGLLGRSLLSAQNPLHEIVHVITGAWGLYAGFSGGLGGPKTYAQIFGVIYTILAVLGFVGGASFLGVGSGIGAGNVIHLVIGVLGLYVGFWSK